MTIVRPPARWGAVKLKGKKIIKFEEKNQINEGWINGGFFVFNKNIFKQFNQDSNYVLEADILPKISSVNQLFAYKHSGFWQCMDTLRDKKILEKLSLNKFPPWLNKKIMNKILTEDLKYIFNNHKFKNSLKNKKIFLIGSEGFIGFILNTI